MFSLGQALRTALHLLIPLRRTEEALQTLSLSALASLAIPRETGGIRFLLPYRDPRVQALVWELKYYAHPRAQTLAASLLSEEILGLLSEELGSALLLPVPMHAKRRAARGFNQTELLCEAVAARCGSEALAYNPQALRRTEERAPQQGLPRQRRLNNVAHTMQAAPEVVGRTCLVVDDVTTTGATLREARRALRAAGAQNVHLLALAR